MPVRRRRGDRVQAQTGEGQFAHVGFAKAHGATMRRIGQYHRIVLRNTSLQKCSPGFSRCASAVEQVLPTDRDTVQGAAP